MAKTLITGKRGYNMKILNNIFSMINEDDHKVITILGMKFYTEKYLFKRLFCFFINKFCKVKRNKIVLSNIQGHQYACNIKYLGNELLKNENLDIVYLYYSNTDKTLLPNNFRLAKYGSLKSLYELSTSRAWLFNSHPFIYQMGLIKSNDTIFFQTFHGSMGIKKIEADAQQTYQDLGWYKWQYKSASTFDYMFVDSEFEKNIFKSAFWGFGKTLKIGKARDCIFYKNPEAYINKVKEYYNIPKENKIVLYAPTWRSDKRCSCYNIDIKLLKKSLNRRFGSEWTVLIRAHSHMKINTFNALYDENQVINAVDYPDMQELLVAADVLISDYSSCIPEYTILKKPSFIYATDIEKYENGFYYPLSTLPTPIATDNGELAENILNFDNDKFVARCNEFLQEMGHEDDENSCKRIVDFILEKMGE